MRTMVSRTANFSQSLTAAVLRGYVAWLVALVVRAQVSVRDARQRVQYLTAALFMALFGVLDRAAAQMTGNGSNQPDAVISSAVCGANGWLSWFTSLKFLVVILVGGLIGFFIGRAVGKRDNDGIVGVIIAILGLGAIRLLVKVVTTC